MKKKTVFILIASLFLMFPVISQAIMLPSSDPILTSAEIITDGNGNPEAIEIKGVLSNDCTQVMYDQVTVMGNTLLVQVFLESTSPFCTPAYLPFTHVVDIDSIPSGLSVTVGLYNGMPATDGVVEVFGDPIVIEQINNDATVPEEILVDIVPATVNLKSKGKFVIVSIELPNGYESQNMMLNSARMWKKIDAEKIYFTDGIFKAKFKRDKVIGYLSTMGIKSSARVEVNLELQFSGNDSFLTVEAKDTIKVLAGR